MAKTTEKTLVDSKIIDGYQLLYYSDGSYRALDKNDNVIYDAKTNDTTKNVEMQIKTKNGKDLKVSFNKDYPFSPDNIKSNGTIVAKGGKEITISNGVVTKTKYKMDSGYREVTYNKDNSVLREYNSDGKLLRENATYNNGIKYSKDYTSNTTKYYKDNKLFCIQNEDGSREYFSGDKNTLKLNKDGTYTKGKEKGTYTIGKDGVIICKDKDNNQTFYNNIGQKYKVIKSDGTVYNYDRGKESQSVTRNGQTSYSRINHIEYDEEAYTNILKSLNRINSSSLTKVNNTFTKAENTINSFPDKYSGNFSGINVNITNHINLIKTLSEMTNYSLLAYQTCDDSLMDGLKLLIDSIFGDSNSVLANTFKGMISATIEEKDGILGYKEGTDFKMLSENAIVASTYIDEDGNKWYLNKNNKVVGLEGKNFKITYGGEQFTLTYDENGVIKLVDSKGKSIQIFGDYNIESGQYGGNQVTIAGQYDNPYILKILEGYFPGATREEITDFLKKATEYGCGNVSMTNLVFLKFQGKEGEFYQKFGFPMYDIALKNNKLTVDYNYEAVTTDLFCYTNKELTGRTSIQQVTMNATGTDAARRDAMEKYLSEKYGVSLKDLPSQVTWRGEDGYTLYNTDGTIEYTDNLDGIGHALIELGKTSDGKSIVSSWGKKYFLEASSSEEAQEFSKINYKNY